MKLSVLIPVYNEEATLAELVGRVLATPQDKEILLIDDCSTDRSPEILKQLAEEHPGLRLFRHDRNRGKGAALATGLREFSGDVVLIQDADLEYDPAEYEKLLLPIREGKADVVYGSRFLGGSYGRAHLYYHYLGNKFLTTVSNVFTNLNLTDMETCYKVFTRDVAKRLDVRSKGFSVEPEMTAKVARMKKRIYEVPISYAGRDLSEGKKIKKRDGITALWAIIRWSLLPLPAPRD
jgi:glycosyltransferase involved in cell wall biosynthesis